MIQKPKSNNFLQTTPQKPMIVYSASTLFYRGKIVSHYPSFATQDCYKTMEDFLDVCEISAREKEMFDTSDVFISCAEISINNKGQSKGINKLVRKFKNYSGTSSKP